MSQTAQKDWWKTATIYQIYPKSFAIAVIKDGGYQRNYLEA
ncbi:hypothetical protein JCM19239_7486 [Vibrio variabilis]|uniref:Uncharacterized protein n=1 Tax=Vibrio variabilis TaxID=990271 RepID=A0ABQ0JDX4_9VIBR|nr:hypothetical protein JCM19239_7486 [Vibrio variabilis]